MPKFLVAASYKAEGARGLRKEGGSSRLAAVREAITGLGGTIEGLYFALGETDLFVIVDLPDTTAALAVSLAVNASGTIGATTTPLFTPEEMDAACKKTVNYRAPGV